MNEQNRFVLVNCTRTVAKIATAKLLLPPPRRSCFHRHLYICLLAELRKNYSTDL